jgi:Rieske Fe-S protein
VQFDEIDAGPLDSFEQDKVYDQYREQGFFIIRRADEVFALSSICTHKGCKVRAQADQSYLCKCHQSRFDATGKVLNGPATADLPRLKVKLSADRHVLVRVTKPSTAN